jgi:hypothetical protein
MVHTAPVKKRKLKSYYVRYRNQREREARDSFVREMIHCMLTIHNYEDNLSLEIVSDNEAEDDVLPLRQRTEDDIEDEERQLKEMREAWN